MAVGTARPALPLPISYPSTPFSPHSRPKSINHFAKRSSLRPIASSSVKADPELSSTEPEAALLEALLGIQGRGRAASPQQLMEVEQAVLALEDLKGVPEPTSSGLIEGRWQLVFTTRPGTASPIQRTFVGVDYFKILQEVSLRTNDPRVSNIIKFSDAIGELKVEAAATIEDGKRILFRFDRAAFAFKFLPFKVPYPVPFRLLGDEAKGWLDTTYLSVTGNIRISRGNKGTTFVLQKKIEPRQRLLSAISVGSGITEVIEEIVSLNQNKCSGDLKNLEGKWQLLWTSQLEDESWQNIAAYGLKGFQIVKENGQLENQVDFFPGFRLHVNGKLMQVPNTNLYNVTMTDAVGLVGTINFPLDISRKFETELLYVDNKIRITRSNNDILYVHFCLGRKES